MRVTIAGNLSLSTMNDIVAACAKYRRVTELIITEADKLNDYLFPDLLYYGFDGDYAEMARICDLVRHMGCSMVIWSLEYPTLMPQSAKITIRCGPMDPGDIDNDIETASPLLKVSITTEDDHIFNHLSKRVDSDVVRNSRTSTRKSLTLDLRSRDTGEPIYPLVEIAKFIDS